MANTVKYDETGIEITFDGSTAWDITDATSSKLGKDAPDGISIRSLRFIPTATAAILIVRNGGATARSILDETAATAYDIKSLYFNHQKAEDRKRKLYVKGTEATNGVKLLIEL